MTQIMSVTQGLTELKTLDARITKAIDEGTYTALAIGKNPITGFLTNEEFNTKAKANLQSVTNLISRRNAIKSAIVNSNANVVVKIGEKQMTVAEAVERKNSIKYEKQLHSRLKMQYANVLNKCEKEKSSANVRLDESIKSTHGKDAKLTAEQYDAVAKPFWENNEPKIQDPLRLNDYLQTLDDEIVEFENNVDYILSESNTLTKIEIQ